MSQNRLTRGQRQRPHYQHCQRSSEDGCIGQSAFSATKGAVAAMTLPLARDLSSLGIRVVAYFCAGLNNLHSEHV
ncbi:UNVERIFIED_CONTAM: hypothetical protein GTU68_061463 [Idotea baltica]|nr:hypothetical protein [Idotea baltica]